MTVSTDDQVIASEPDISIMKTDKFTQQSLRLRIELQGIMPPIWREIDVPPAYSFWDLHVAIQDAMGWLDYHLHVFHMEDPKTGGMMEIGIPDDEGYADGMPILAGWDIPIQSYLSEPGQSVQYDYDFGDDWNHQVLLKQIVPSDGAARYPLCVGGERACPPEDCGGIRGYQQMLEVISDPAHEEHDDMLQWLGGSFDPERFDSATVQFDDPRERWRRAFEE